MQLFSSKNCLCWNKFSWREGGQISQSKISSKIGGETVWTCANFYRGPPQMCYVGDANGSCPQCPECYGRIETVLQLANMFARDAKKQDRFWSETKEHRQLLRLPYHPEPFNLWPCRPPEKCSTHTVMCRYGPCPQCLQNLQVRTQKRSMFEKQSFWANGCHWCWH